jgi:hypothetical protein
MYPHRIRLRGPWDCDVLARFPRHSDRQTEPGEQELPPAIRMTLPCRWNEGGLCDFAGRVRYRRSFGAPRRLDNYERVWLTFAGADSTAAVWLNGQFLGEHQGSSEAFEFEITSLLHERNELIVEVESPDMTGGLYGEVALEVRCAAFLRAVRAWLTENGTGTVLRVAGEVVGVGDSTLELYAVLDRSTVAYSTVEARPTGTPFQLVSDPLDEQSPRCHRVSESRLRTAHVELVHGGIIWSAVDVVIESEPAESQQRSEAQR